MTPLLVDQDGAASRAAAEGKFALATGDTTLAHKKYGEAGAILESQVAVVRRQPERHLLRFLAASQYFYGGHYDKALKLCRRVEERFLPNEVRKQFQPFFRDVERRASPGYVEGINNTLMKLWHDNRHADMIDVLKSHPHVFEPERLAFLRAVLCEQLKDYQAAAIFYASALKHAPDDPDNLSLSAGLVFELVGRGRINEAWEYVQYQLQHIPHAVTFAVAANVCMARANETKDQSARRQLMSEVVRYFDEAWKAYQCLPDRARQDSDIRRSIGVSLTSAGLALQRLGDKTRAKEVADRAIAFDSTHPRGWMLRGFVTYPSESALADIQEAIQRDPSWYYPYFFLAGVAMHRQDYREARPLIERALSFNMNDRDKALLYFWFAYCKYNLGEPAEVVDSLFQAAIKADPERQEITTAYSIFKGSQADKVHDRQLPFKSLTVKEPEIDIDAYFDREKPLKVASFKRSERVRVQLQSVGNH